MLVAALSHGCTRFQNLSPVTDVVSKGIWVTKSSTFLGLRSGEVLLFCHATNPNAPVCYAATGDVGDELGGQIAGAVQSRRAQEPEEASTPDAQSGSKSDERASGAVTPSIVSDDENGPKSPPSVLCGQSSSVLESLDRPTVTCAMNTARLAIQECARPYGHGTVALSVRTSAEGYVLTVTGNSEGSLQSCIIDVVKQIVFPKTRAGAEFTVPLKF